MTAPKIKVEFEFETTEDGMDRAVALMKYADKLNAAAPKTEPAPAPAPKGKPAPAPAPKGKAAAAPPKGKTNSKAPAKEPEQADIMDFSGDNEEDEEQEDGGLGLGDVFDQAEDFEGTPEEAKEEALAKLRTMLSNGHKAHVKEVQQIMKVAKFHDVPAEQGHEFLKRVKEVEAKIAAN